MAKLLLLLLLAFVVGGCIAYNLNSPQAFQEEEEFQAKGRPKSPHPQPKPAPSPIPDTGKAPSPVPDTSKTPTPAPKTSGIEALEFVANWCEPCRKFAPTWKAWEKKYSSSSVTFTRVNVDLQKALASKYKVSAVPTVLILKDGEEVKRWSPPPSEEDFASQLK